MAPTGMLQVCSTLDLGLPLTAFGDLRVAEINGVVGWTFNYNVNADIVTSTTTGSGTVTQSNGKAVLQTGAAASSSATITTKDALRYIPGLVSQVRMTALFTPGALGSSQLIGIGDQADGLFFGYVDQSFGVLRRQNGTDTFVPQSGWNGDHFDGTGPSGAVLDPTKGNVYVIQFQWLGFGPIQFAIEDPNTGEVVVAHTIQYLNNNVNPSIFNPTLPLMAQVASTTNTANLTLQTASALGITEGNGGRALVTRNSVRTNKVILTEQALVTIQNKPMFQGKTNRLRIRTDFLSISSSGTRPVQVRLVRATLPGRPEPLPESSRYPDRGRRVDRRQRDGRRHELGRILLNPPPAGRAT